MLKKIAQASGLIVAFAGILLAIEYYLAGQQLKKPLPDSLDDDDVMQ